jgi:hypothetical protein
VNLETAGKLGYQKFYASRKKKNRRSTALAETIQEVLS